MEFIMDLLAFDATTTSCSVACWSSGNITEEHLEHSNKRQAEFLMPMIIRTMKKARCDFSSLDGIAVTIGPGSFTGVRIGLATGRGLALAAELPLVGITTFQALSAAVLTQKSNEIILASLDARRNQLYIQLFSKTEKPISDPFTSSSNDLPTFLLNKFPEKPKFLLVGSGSPIIAEALHEIDWRFNIPNLPLYPQANVIARVVAKRGLNMNEHKEVRPLYLRSPGIGSKEKTSRI